MLGRQHEEGRAEERVGPGREHREVERRLLAAEDHLGALRAADPVALHRDHALRARSSSVEVLQQPVGVVGDLEEPLLELLHDDRRAAALAAPVDHLLVRQHGLVLRAPLDRRALAVGEPALEQLQEDPLGPAVVARARACRTRGRQSIETPQDLNWRRNSSIDLFVETRRVLAGLDRVVLGRQAERVVAHRVQDPHAVAAAVSGPARRPSSSSSGGPCAARPRGRAASRARSSCGVRVEAGLAGVGHLPGALALPELLPLALDRVRLVALGRSCGSLKRPRRERAGAVVHASRPPRGERIDRPAGRPFVHG